MSNLDSRHLAPWGRNAVVIDEPQHRDTLGKMLLRKRGVAIGEDDDAGRRIVLHVLMDILENDLKIRAAATSGPNIQQLIINDEIDDAIAHIEAAVKENLSDGVLYKEIADMLLGMHTLKQPGEPSIFLERIANYYERALELLPEKTDDISYSLITVYGKLGNAEKAEEAWARLEYIKHDKKWAHAELLYLMKDYDRAVVEIKELVLRQIFDLSRGLTFLHDALSFTGNTELADVAVDADAKLQELFGLWRGLDIINRASSAIEAVPGETEEVKLSELISNGVSQDTLSTCPLFSDVKLGGLPTGEGSSVDLMADILNAIKKLK